MSYVIAEPCIATCDQACLDVCPVDAIHGPVSRAEISATPKDERATKFPKLQLFIDPEGCICCAACVAECPVAAIFEEAELPRAWRSYAERNAAFFRAAPCR